MLGEARASAKDGNAALAVSLLDRASLLWRGDAYGELAYEDFAQAEAERLEELRLLAVEEHLEGALELGRHRQLPRLHGLTSEHPLRERLHGQLMLALYRCGRQTDDSMLPIDPFPASKSWGSSRAHSYRAAAANSQAQS